MNHEQSYFSTTEFIVAFFLVLTIGLTVINESQFAPLAIGSALMGLSGRAYFWWALQPAVSLAVAIQGEFFWAQLVPYWASQIAGAFVASLIVQVGS